MDEIVHWNLVHNFGLDIYNFGQTVHNFELNVHNLGLNVHNFAMHSTNLEFNLAMKNCLTFRLFIVLSRHLFFNLNTPRIKLVL